MSKENPQIHVVGMGTIGEPIIYLLLETKKELGIDRITFHKKNPLPEEQPKVRRLTEKGAMLTVDADKFDKFKELGMIPYSVHEEALECADVVIDCTPMGNKLKDEYYLKLSGKYPSKGFIAQGSEENFGVPYAWNINDSSLKPVYRYIQVVSCNTHQIVCPLFTLLLKDNGGLTNLRYGKFFIARRSSDISEDKLNPGVEAEPFKDKYAEYGTHQGYDAARIIKSVFGQTAKIPIHSQIIKLPTQYMHTMLFDIETLRKNSLAEVKRKLLANPLVVPTKIKTNNRVFAIARDASPIRGRILNQTVLYEPSLDVSPNGRHIRGTCFTPQDGNSLLSSMAAMLYILDHSTYLKKMKVFDKYLFKAI